MGTVVSFDVRPPVAAESEVRVALARATALLHRLDAIFSLWKPESPMSRIRRRELAVEDAPAVVAEVLEACEQARTLSAGFFDASALPGGVDPTGLVKGWAAEQALACLLEAGASNLMINAGGDVVVAGAPEPGAPWRIGIQSPSARGRLATIVEVKRAVATSGEYERGAHLFDPAIGQFRSCYASASVTGPSLALADALATALAVGGDRCLQVIESLPGYEGLGIDAAGKFAATSAFPFAPDAPG